MQRQGKRIILITTLELQPGIIHVQINPWKRFDMAFDELKRSTTLSPLSPLANLFLLAGDIHATLYTGSKAIHNKFFPMK
jgi:hypothetical protein